MKTRPMKMMLLLVVMVQLVWVWVNMVTEEELIWVHNQIVFVREEFIVVTEEWGGGVEDKNRRRIVLVNMVA